MPTTATLKEHAMIRPRFVVALVAAIGMSTTIVGQDFGDHTTLVARANRNVLIAIDTSLDFDVMVKCFFCKNLDIYLGHGDPAGGIEILFQGGDLRCNFVMVFP